MGEADEPEVVLLGGTANRGQVVQVGDTVRRPQRPTSPATHTLLRHLADVGFAGAPRFLGVDALGREVLSFVPRAAVTPPYPAWALTDEALARVAGLLRDYHRAVSTFDPGPCAWPASPPAPFAGELISHNDSNLDNVVFRDGRAVALIDFDLASPGCRVGRRVCRPAVGATPARPLHRRRPVRPRPRTLPTLRGRLRMHSRRAGAPRVSPCGGTTTGATTSSGPRPRTATSASPTTGSVARWSARHRPTSGISTTRTPCDEHSCDAPAPRSTRAPRHAPACP